MPIVPGAAIFDLVAAGGARPGAGGGRGRARRRRGRRPGRDRQGRAGRGATVGKWHGPDHLADGGLGFAATRVGEANVAAIAVVNAVGDVIADDGTVLAGSDAPPGTEPFPDLAAFEAVPTTTASPTRRWSRS